MDMKAPACQNYGKNYDPKDSLCYLCDTGKECMEECIADGRYTEAKDAVLNSSEALKSTFIDECKIKPYNPNKLGCRNCALSKTCMEQSGLIAEFPNLKIDKLTNTAMLERGLIIKIKGTNCAPYVRFQFSSADQAPEGLLADLDKLLDASIAELESRALGILFKYYRNV